MRGEKGVGASLGLRRPPQLDRASTAMVSRSCESMPAGKSRSCSVVSARARAGRSSMAWRAARSSANSSADARSVALSAVGVGAGSGSRRTVSPSLLRTWARWRGFGPAGRRTCSSAAAAGATGGSGAGGTTGPAGSCGLATCSSLGAGSGDALWLAQYQPPSPKPTATSAVRTFAVVRLPCRRPKPGPVPAGAAIWHSTARTSCSTSAGEAASCCACRSQPRNSAGASSASNSRRGFSMSLMLPPPHCVA
jgi:hypothetical protein